MPESLTGSIDRVTFHNPDTGYCVLKVRAKGHSDAVAVVGTLTRAIAGEFIEASGEWMNDSNYGPQFRAAEIRTAAPHTREGIVKYLSSGLVKGIGPTYAKKIVEAFGDKTLEIIDRDVSFLNQVKGIGPKRIALIRDGWLESKAVRSILVFLQSYGIGISRAHRIYKTYGDTAVEIIRENPYRLSADIWGVGFQTADELALKLGIPHDSPQRLNAALRHVLQTAASTGGHVALPETVAIEQTVLLTGAEEKRIEDTAKVLVESQELVRDLSPDGALLYLKGLHFSEVGVANALKRLMKGPHPLGNLETDKAVTTAEARMGIQFAPSQRSAVLAACSKKVMVVTGGPGTGKTTIVRAIVDVFRANGRFVLLAAPTGRAAKRLSESTSMEAKTIHRLLEYDPALGDFRRSQNHPLEADVVIVDEASMLDVSLANQLLRAIPPAACVVLVGDVDQLPSVGAGQVLADLISSGTVTVARLTEIHRQAGASQIVRAAHAVNHGEEPLSCPPGQGDFFIIEADEPSMVLDTIEKVVKERIPARFGFDPLRDVQVLSPMNKTDLGVGNLNVRLQACLNPADKSKREVQRNSMTFRVGDKVLQTRNNYQKEVYNGDVGRVDDVDSIEQLVMVIFDGRTVLYEFGELDELTLAYCVSIHKSQGSEYPAVVIPVHTQHFVMLQRNLLYTAITRGRKLVVLVGSKKALWLAVTRAETKTRYSMLAHRLRQDAL